MAVLLINFARKLPKLPVFNDYEFYYQIGSINYHPKNKICLNNQKLLNGIALEERENYSDWIYSINKEFLKKKLIFNDDLSLFFLTDLSNKRSELFDTYNNVCNILLLKKIIKDKGITKIIINNAPTRFIRSLRSLFDKKIIILNNKRNFFLIKKSFLFIKALNHTKLLLKYFIYITTFQILINKTKINTIRCKNLFFTRFPLHFLKDAKLEEKYTFLVGKDDKFITNLNTDGLHQSLSLFNCYKQRLKIKIENESQHIVVDDFVTLNNLAKSIYESLWLFIPFYKIGNKKYIYKNIDISLSIKKEINLSYQRILGNLICHRALKKILEKTYAKKYIYYLNEFVFGRMITYTLHKANRYNTFGMQHGIPSKRKLCFNLSQKEIPNNNKNYLKKVPIPKTILVEDYKSKSLYEGFGYKKFEIFDEVPRLYYLKKLKIPKKRNKVLIVPGLHDFEMIYNQIIDIVIDNPKERFVIKPHPRSKTNLNNLNLPSNLEITNEHISKILVKSKHVYVSYSSVGYEAKSLNIPITVIDCPGLINESGLFE